MVSMSTITTHLFIMWKVLTTVIDINHKTSIRKTAQTCGYITTLWSRLRVAMSFVYHQSLRCVCDVPTPLFCATGYSNSICLRMNLVARQCLSSFLFSQPPIFLSCFLDESIPTYPTFHFNAQISIMNSEANFS